MGDGRLDLRDAYVYYLDADMYLPPQVEGELPATPLHFEELEWNKEFTGDTIKGKPAWKKARWPICLKRRRGLFVQAAWVIWLHRDCLRWGNWRRQGGGEGRVPW